MTFKTLLAASILLVVPALAQAQCYGSEEAAISCAEGTTWDAAQMTCVTGVSS